MTHLSRLTLFSTTASSLGGIVFLGSLIGEAISGGRGAVMGAARATVAPASSSSDFPICHTPATAEHTNIVLRLAQARTEVPPTEMKAAVPAPAFADSDPPLWDGLGSVTYKISTSSAEAQAYFDQGLRLAYAFNHGEAQRAFRKAQKLDPSCAMCFWGEALVLGPNINLPMQADAVGPAFAAVQRALALSTNASPREQALVVALATRYAQDPKADRAPLDAAYAAAMGKLAADFSDDNEIALLYAEAVMDLSPWNYWQPGGHEPNPQSAPIVPTLERVLAKEPNHPGAIHFYIHAVEASDRPQRAEPHADRLRGAIPSAGHLVHMPSHIYYRIGRYLDALADNKIATTVDEKYLVDTNAPMGVYRLGYYPHNVHFVLASAQMAGDGATVIAAAEKLRGLIPDEAARDIAMVHPVKRKGISRSRLLISKKPRLSKIPCHTRNHPTGTIRCAKRSEPRCCRQAGLPRRRINSNARSSAPPRMAGPTMGSSKSIRRVAMPRLRPRPRLSWQRPGSGIANCCRSQIFRNERFICGPGTSYLSLMSTCLPAHSCRWHGRARCSSAITPSIPVPSLLRWG